MEESDSDTGSEDDNWIKYASSDDPAANFRRQELFDRLLLESSSKLVDRQIDVTESETNKRREGEQRAGQRRSTCK